MGRISTNLSRYRMMRVMPRSAWPGFAVLSLLLLAAPDVRAQAPTTGTLTGQVVDEEGVPVREVRILASEAGTGLVRSGTTDSNGEFRFLFMPTGDYEVTAERLGYAPKRVIGVPVRPGAEQPVTVRVRGIAAPAQEIDVEYFNAATNGSTAVHTQWISSSMAAAHPARHRSLTDLVRLSSTWDDDLGLEGLPGWLSSVRYDGVELPNLGPFDEAAPSLVPLVSVRSAELLGNALDVVWGGAAGGIVSGHAQRGAQEMHVDTRATWTGDALPVSSIEDVGYTDIRGEARVRGPVFGEGGAFALGLDARSLGTPVTAAWDPGAPSDAVLAYAAANGADLSGYTLPGVREGDAVNAFASLDVPIGEGHALGARALVSTVGAAALPGSGAAAATTDATDIIGAAHLHSRFSTTKWNHLQIGIASSSAERDPLAVAPLTLVSDGLATERLHRPQTTEQMVFDAYNAFGMRIDAHDLKFGAGIRVGTHTYTGIRPASGEYFFGGLDQLTAQTGVLVRTEAAGDDAEWTAAEYSAFAQDRWQVRPGLEVLVGARLDLETLPRENVELDSEWLRLTGVANYLVEKPGPRISPRAGITWSPDNGRAWLIELGGGMFHDRFDPLMLAEWQSDDGAARVRRAVGAVAWPPAGTAGGTSAIHLTVLSSGFNAPRTTRVSGAVTRMIESGTSIQVAASVRRTDNLPRRTDLNLAPETGARDQYGRPVYGVLVQQGGLLVEAPGTSRRFATYDEVAAVSADGESDYWGVTVALDQQVAGMADLFARYTFSRTTDNWFAARAGGGWHIARPTGLDANGDWTEGVSDFDVPHRAVAGVVIDAPFGLQLSALYRAESGRPFTPGFRAGVDANADGESRNDPAFVDGAQPGMSELFGRWSCLSASTGEFAERNSCRTDMVHAVDASVAFRLFTAAGVSTSIIVDGFDLLDTERTRPDAALYLVDPAGALVDDGAGTISVPLIVNPDFGEPVAYPHNGRIVRIGLSLNW